jgi:hypothetical protein
MGEIAIRFFRVIFFIVSGEKSFDIGNWLIISYLVQKNQAKIIKVDNGSECSLR